MMVPSREKDTALELAPWGTNWRGSRPLATSKTMTLGIENLPMARRRPSGEKATEEIWSSGWPKRWISRPLPTSQMRAVPSRLPVTMVRPSGEKAAEVTFLLCPAKVRISRPLDRSQRRAVTSPVVSAKRLSGEIATEVMESEWPSWIFSSTCEAALACHSRLQQAIVQT